MSWEHDLDKILWSGGRTLDHANDSVYEPQLVKDFLYDYITDTDSMPTVRTIMDSLDLEDEFYEEVESTLYIYDHAEEIEFREVEGSTNERSTSSI